MSSVKEWIRGCLSSQTQNHAICSLPTPLPGTPRLPSRLVEVQVNNSIFDLKLVCGKKLGPETEYIFLSYCWGGAVQAALNKKRLELYKSRIPWEDLPKTLQDAAVATHRLGIRFLWVDSSYIIQDDDGDKAKEIGQMTQVFSRSILTIIARRARDAVQGFLHKRETPAITSVLPSRSPDSTSMGWATLYFVWASKQKGAEEEQHEEEEQDGEEG